MSLAFHYYHHTKFHTGPYSEKISAPRWFMELDGKGLKKLVPHEYEFSYIKVDYSRDKTSTG